MPQQPSPCHNQHHHHAVEDLEAHHVLKPRTLRGVKVAAWGVSLGIGAYLVLAHQWEGNLNPSESESRSQQLNRNNVFTHARGELKRWVTARYYGGQGDWAGKDEGNKTN